ncbi:hypothetical protein ABZ845_17595 [Streptomyces sp. NPDC047022]|uniref:hypothetical protein n=1 Tax=Streptomyces sp. NPDC047022 TaxID=3155737 RepID=UPI0033EB51E4
MSVTPLLTAQGRTLREAGEDWDAVRVPRQHGVAAIGILGARCGAVLDYPQPLYFFVARGTATDWNVHGTTAVGTGTTLTIPPARYTSGPGPYWRVCPGDSNWLTDVHALQAALEDCSEAPA